ncbi:MAG: hypothetical protein K8R68_04750 [Bacteroidales bacterium]|nr:hypothetical protein [Bacteroidales bacterium]
MILGSFINNPFFTLISLTLAVVGIILSIYFFKKGKREKKPCYAVAYFNLISKYVKEFSELDINYKGKPVDNLTISKFAFWNAGKETIRKKDLINDNPLRIKMKDDFIIYGFEKLFESESTNNFDLELSKDKTEIIISFDYLDYGQGVLIRILHSGNTRNDLNLNGKIIGVLDLKKPNTSFAPTEFLTKSGYFDEIDKYLFR